MTQPLPAPGRERRRLRLRGAVQGVGFRPFVHRLASELELTGHVLNDPSGVLIEVEGSARALSAFERRLFSDKPPAATPELVERRLLPPTGGRGFAIRHSERGGPPTAVLLPDLATCADCAREVAEATNRRHGYPFTNCTHCGPRFSIIERVPYDRPHTTMRSFVQCARCAAEYADPGDRRFHAQPNACPDCGPRLTFTAADGVTLATDGAALQAAAALVEAGGILALHGLGGFHLVVDARCPAAVETLRQRKARWEKPFAVMVPDLSGAEALCRLDATTRSLLTSAESPIVLLPRQPDGPLAEAVAPGTPWLGVMLPYTPLHHLLLSALRIPVVATSGNRSDEPICIAPDEARARLAGIADRFLVHDRPIVRQVDDSVVAIVAGAPQLWRRSRGYAPRPLRLSAPVPCVLAVGPHLKSTIALLLNDEAFISQHIGDLETPLARDALARVVVDFLDLYAAAPRAVAHDLHPDYASTAWLLTAHAAGQRPGAPAWQAKLAAATLIPVQHHHAHLVACLTEHRHHGEALGITWDGAGLGPDGSVWGGEFLLGDAHGYERVAHLRPFALPGGDAAAREPRRCALGLLHAAGLLERAARLGVAPLAAFSRQERGILDALLARGVNAPSTTSAGRLFDGLAALVGLRQQSRFEGQAAIELELLALRAAPGAGAYPCPRVAPSSPGSDVLCDWEPLLVALLDDLERGTEPAVIAARCHAGLAAGIVEVAVGVEAPVVALSGGCFQNRLLSELATTGLTTAGCRVLLHRQVPPHDGGVSLGQAVIAAAASAGSR